MFSSNSTGLTGANYIEDVFSTWLYTGTGTTAGSTQTITNGIDLAGEGGMVWIKDRAVKDHFLFDTNRGPWKYLKSNSTDAEPGVNEDALSAFNSNGFTLTGDNNVTQNGQNYASWTFRKQEKFFDVVTYTGNDVAGRTVAHNLGSEPAVIIVKSTSAAGDWAVYHRSLGATKYILLNGTAAAVTDSSYWQNTTPTSTEFTLGGAGRVNYGGRSYVAYLFAHDAGGFGLTGTDNVVSCGSYTATNGVALNVNLGFEPAWIIVKKTNSTGYWWMQDNMRGWGAVNSGDYQAYLQANDSGSESLKSTDGLILTSTGFTVPATSGDFNSNGTYIYIAIRRGPMKVPTTGTSVFGVNARTGTGANATVTGSAGVSDAVLVKNRGAAVASLFAARLTGTNYLVTSTTAAQVAAGVTILQANPWDVMDGVKVGTTSTITNASANTYINYLFDRAPGFFDVVCYTGTGSLRTVNHNLGVAPELMIIKSRNGTRVWRVYNRNLTANAELNLNSTAAVSYSATNFNDTDPTSTVFTVNTNSAVNAATDNYVAYLFATLAGVSKVGSYTGNGTTQTIDCGFTGGARFVLIKRTDSTGDWYVWDSARGIVSGDDPYLLLNSAAAEVTNTDYVDTYSAGFEISSTAPAAINASSGTFIFLAIA